MRHAMTLAMKDMLSDPLQVACTVLLIAGMMAPLLLLMAINAGVMGTLIGDLRGDPSMRHLSIVGNHDFDAEMLDRLRAWPEVAFVVPQARSLARRLEMRRQDGPRFVAATLLPSGHGEPLLDEGPSPSGSGQIAASAGLAARLGIGPGDIVEAIARRGDPVSTTLLLPLKVVAVVPGHRLDGNAVLIDAAAIERIESFFDGYAIPEFGVAAGLNAATRPERVESFRIYARDIEDVAGLEARLEEALATEVRSKTGQIALFLGLERNLGKALALLMGAAVVGLAAALVALFWSGVIRKRRVLSMLALLGFERHHLAAFPVSQAAIYGVAGGLAAIVLAWLASLPVEAMFASPLQGGRVVDFEAWMIASVFGGLLVISVAASAVAASVAARSEPAHVLRLTAD